MIRGTRTRRVQGYTSGAILVIVRLCCSTRGHWYLMHHSIQPTAVARPWSGSLYRWWGDDIVGAPPVQGDRS